MIIAQGGKAGGFSGTVSTMVLVPQLVDAVSPIPVVAAGGIFGGRGIAAAISCRRIRKQPSRGRMLWYYICARGRIGQNCPGGGIPMPWTSSTRRCSTPIETTLLSAKRLQSIVDRATARQQAAPSRAQRQAELERQLREAKARVDRYCGPSVTGSTWTRFETHSARPSRWCSPSRRSLPRSLAWWGRASTAHASHSGSPWAGLFAGTAYVSLVVPPG